MLLSTALSNLHIDWRAICLYAIRYTTVGSSDARQGSGICMHGGHAATQGRDQGTQSQGAGVSHEADVVG